MPLLGSRLHARVNEHKRATCQTPTMEGRRHARRQAVGCILFLAGPGVVFATHAASRSWLRHLAEADPIPNQNAMVQAFLADVAAAAIIVIIMAVGLWLFVTKRRDTHDA